MDPKAKNVARLRNIRSIRTLLQWGQKQASELLNSTEIAAAGIVRTDFDPLCEEASMSLEYFAPAPLPVVARVVESQEPDWRPTFPEGGPVLIRTRDARSSMEDVEGIKGEIWSAVVNSYLHLCIPENGIYDTSGWQTFKTNKVNYGGTLSEYRPHRPANFRSVGLWDQLLPSFPHQICTTIHDVDSCDDLAHSEIMVILTIMKGRMRLKWFAEHVTVPVLMISYLGQGQIRVIQAHMNNGALHLRVSSLINLQTENKERIHAVLRWFLAKPIGSTAPNCPGTVPPWPQDLLENCTATTQPLLEPENDSVPECKPEPAVMNESPRKPLGEMTGNIALSKSPSSQSKPRTRLSRGKGRSSNWSEHSSLNVVTRSMKSNNT